MTHIWVTYAHDTLVSDRQQFHLAVRCCKYFVANRYIRTSLCDATCLNLLTHKSPLKPMLHLAEFEFTSSWCNRLQVNNRCDSTEEVCVIAERS